MNKKEIHTIVLTGGPCAGKSTALSKIEKLLTNLGFNVLLVNETATELILNGLTIKRFGLVYFQKVLTEYLLQKENTYFESAKLLNGKTVIICDRGAMDAKAYVGEKIFKSIIKNLHLTETELMNRYDAVIHMTTAADGAEEFYSNESNSARYESIEEAKLIDKEILKAWTGHNKLRIISNNGTFEDKINAVLETVCSIIGVPKPVEIERKFLIVKPDFNYIISNYDAKHYKIVQDYLISENNIERRVRKIFKPDGCNYYYTEKRNISDIKRFEVERKISEKEYLTYLEFKDPNFKTIEKERFYFVYKNQYFELDNYSFMPDTAILELEMANENQTAIIPEFIDVLKEVTFNPKYKNYNLAKINKKH
mgnify:FL=1